MSRSYRKPYFAYTGAESAHEDKKIAAPGLRRSLKQWLHTVDDSEAAIILHLLECPHNNNCAWDRDGRQHLVWGSNGPDPEFHWQYKY